MLWRFADDCRIDSETESTARLFEKGLRRSLVFGHFICPFRIVCWSSCDMARFKMHISKKAAPPPYLPTIMLLHTLEVLTPVSYCIMQRTQNEHFFAYQKIFIHFSIHILGILKTGKKCVKMHKRSLLHSFERPRRNIDSFVLDVLKTGTSAKDSGAAYNLFYCLFCLQQIWNSFLFYFWAFLWRQRIYDFLLNLSSKKAIFL